jgi:glutamate-1-semialdehyde 2,1-aminomutase
MTIAFIQARMGSIRLPNKVMKTVNGKPLIEYLLLRVAKAKLIDKVVVASSVNSNNDPLVSFVNSLGFETYRGSEQDVLSRFYEAAKFHKATTVLRITADCPLVDPNLIDSLIEEYFNSGTDYATNTLPPTYPDGLDIEVFSFQSLERAYQEAVAPNEREHVTPYIRYSGQFKIHNTVNKIDYSDRRWTVDEVDDFEVVSNIFQHFHPDIYFDWENIIKIENLRPEMFQKNKHIKRNEGAEITDEEKLQKRDSKTKDI